MPWYQTIQGLQAGLRQVIEQNEVMQQNMMLQQKQSHEAQLQQRREFESVMQQQQQHRFEDSAARFQLESRDVMQVELVRARDQFRSEVLSENSQQLAIQSCLLYTSPSPRDKRQSRMPSSA